MAKYKITVDQDACIGCAACTAVSKNFRMADNGKSEPIKPDVDELKENEKEAAEICPVSCIKIEENKE